MQKFSFSIFLLSQIISIKTLSYTKNKTYRFDLEYLNVVTNPPKKKGFSGETIYELKKDIPNLKVLNLNYKEIVIYN